MRRGLLAGGRDLGAKASAKHGASVALRAALWPGTKSILDSAKNFRYDGVVSTTTFAHILAENARAVPERRAIAYLASNNAIGSEFNYRDLASRVRSLGKHIFDRTEVGDRVVLLFPPNGLDFAVCFYAAVHAGVVPVPVFPPYGRQMQESLGRLSGISRKANPTLVLTNQNAFDRGGAMLKFVPGLETVPTVITDDVTEPSSFEPVDRGGDDPCFLQFTSGSTGDPKGVIITHDNLLANQVVIHGSMESEEGHIGLNWLPLYHDMGLIGHLLGGMYVKGTLYMMSPLDFLKRPLRWLDAISRYGVQTSGAPNFALDLCCRRISDDRLVDLDLETWTGLHLGGEPIRPASLERFTEKFKSVGFKPSTFISCYGLAESTLFVTGYKSTPEPIVTSFDAASLERGVAKVGEGDSAIQLVGWGSTAPDHEVQIIPIDSNEVLEEGVLGEICTKGPSVTTGYWNDPETTARLFVETKSHGRFLRTGDLGFLWKGELYVAGRHKDLIIVDGRNVYPQDLELSAETAAQNIRPGCSAAFSVEREGREQVILVAEVERRKPDASPPPDIVRKRKTSNEIIPGFEPERPGVMSLAETKRVVRETLAKDYSVAIEFVPIIPGSLPKTSSGKVRRNKTKQAYLSADLEVFSRLTLTPPKKGEA